MMNYFPHLPMFYRLTLVLGLLILPLASAEAAYQEDYIIPRESASSQSSASSTSSADAVNGTQYTMPSTESTDWVIIEDSAEDVWEESDTTMTRGAFIAHLVRSMYTQGQIDSCFWSISPTYPQRFTLIFTDVTVNDPYAKEICVAMRDGIIRGYIDGSFAPERILTFAESAKILSRAYVLAPYAHTDVRNPWYASHVRALVARNAVPESIIKLSQPINTAEAREMMDRLKNNITWRPYQTEEVLFPVVRLRVTAAPATPSVTESTSSTSSSGMNYSSTSSKPMQASSAASEQPSSAVSSKQAFWDLF